MTETPDDTDSNPHFSAALAAALMIDSESVGASTAFVPAFVLIVAARARIGAFGWRSPRRTPIIVGAVDPASPR